MARRLAQEVSAAEVRARLAHRPDRIHAAQTIAAGWLTLRPFTSADIPWVYDVSLDPALQHHVQVPWPYRIEHAAFFVQQLARKRAWRPARCKPCASG